MVLWAPAISAAVRSTVSFWSGVSMVRTGRQPASTPSRSSMSEQSAPSPTQTWSDETPVSVAVYEKVKTSSWSQSARLM
jgi:hypothetical protein